MVYFSCLLISVPSLISQIRGGENCNLGTFFSIHEVLMAEL